MTFCSVKYTTLAGEVYESEVSSYQVAEIDISNAYMRGYVQIKTPSSLVFLGVNFLAKVEIIKAG